jgi:transcription antitermination protein NusB
MARRSRAREVALQALFQDDLNPQESPKLFSQFLNSRIKLGELRDFARSLVMGVKSKRAELDALLEHHADNWSLTRMAATDRNVLRLGAFEIRYTDTPDRVAIDESVELAKRFGSANSSQFVNGILDQLMHEQKAES